MRDLDLLYLEAFLTIRTLQAERSVGRCLCLPRLPAPLTESIAALSVETVFEPGAQPGRPSDSNDLAVEGVAAVPVVAAVKGTGPAGWVSITVSDRRADCLLWIDYARRLESGGGAVQLIYFDAPPATWITAKRLSLARAIHAHPRSPARFEIDLQLL